MTPNATDDSEKMELGLLLFFLFLAAAALGLAAKTVRVVPQATFMVVERLGRFHKLADSGLHVLVPFLDRPRGVQPRPRPRPSGRSRALPDRGDPAQYPITQRYIEGLRDMSKGDNSKVIIMPVETSTMLSGVGAIKEVLSRSGEGSGPGVGTGK